MVKASLQRSNNGYDGLYDGPIITGIPLGETIGFVGTAILELSAVHLCFLSIFCQGDRLKAKWEQGVKQADYYFDIQADTHWVLDFEAHVGVIPT